MQLNSELIRVLNRVERIYSNPTEGLVPQKVTKAKQQAQQAKNKAKILQSRVTQLQAAKKSSKSSYCSSSKNREN